jgi:hypothetical protein
MSARLALAVVTAGICFVGSARAADFESVRGHAVAASQEEAVKEAYFAILDRALTGLAGNQAAGAIGENFRRSFARDFDTFKSRYFSADTDFRCQPRDNGRVACEVAGSMRRTALETDVRKAIKDTEQALSNSLTFVLSAAEAKSSQGDFVIDKLSGAFAAAGHRIVTGNEVDRAISSGKVDFSLGVYEVTFSKFDYDTYDQRMTGSLTIRFKLNQPKTGRQIASLPVQVTSQIAGPSPDVLRAEIVSDLAAKAAHKIASKVNESVVTTQREQEADTAASRREASGQTLYLVRLNGIAKRDRSDIRAVRESISALYPDAVPTVDPEASNDTLVTVRFGTARKIVPDDLVDRFYASNADRGKFDAEYVGGNEFILYY